MVDTDARSNSHALTAALGLNGYTLYHLLIWINADGSVVGLDTCCQGRTSSRRIGNGVGGGIGRGVTCIRERGKAKGRSTDASILLLSKKHLRGVDLVQPHAVADKIKHILSLLSVQSDSQQNKE